MPMVEPDPIEKTKDNKLTNNTLIYRNTGPTKDKFPYVVKDKNTGEFYAYKNVKYHWFFEQPDGDKKKVGDGNKNGVSGGEVWTPFMNLRSANKTYLEEFAEKKVTENDIWDKKLYPNRHTAAFDSGIAEADAVEDSTLLQQVGMIMTYEVAPLGKSLATSGPGYPDKAMDTADPTGDIPGTVNLAAAPDDSAFQKKVKTKPRPADLASWNLTATIDGKTYTEFTDYNVVYVEDYVYPEVSKDFLDPKGSVYTGVVGKYLGYNGGKKGMEVSYTNDNPDLLPTSPAISSSFDYYFSNDELYNLKDPFDDGKVMFFYCLKSNGAYGPYIGKVNEGMERDFYEGHHPYWKSAEVEKREEFLANRYANSWDANFLEPWEKGAVYYILYRGGSGKTRVSELNDAWKASDPSKLSVLNDMKAEISGKTGEVADSAKASIAALENFIKSSSEGTRSATRFAHIGFTSDTGRCSIGKITLENIPAQHSETVEKVTDPSTGQQVKVKTGSWTVAGKRVILPRHFATNSIEWNDNTPSPPAGAKTPEMINYYSELCNHPPDMLMTQEVSNCCGNAAPAGSLIKVEDNAGISKPMLSVTVEDTNNGQTHKIGVPPMESLEAGSELICRDAKTGAIVKTYGDSGVHDDFDMANNDWVIKKSNGDEVMLPKIPTDLEGPDKNGIPVEDQRIKFNISPYDNIDSLTPFRGVLKTEVQIEALDENQNPTGQLEQIEYEQDGQMMASTNIVADGSGLDRYKLNDFDPKVSFYHIFRAPGWYQFKVKAYDRGKDGGLGNSREMKFNINVAPASFKTRSLDGSSR
jgi:hypothetical protein